MNPAAWVLATSVEISKLKGKKRVEGTEEVRQIHPPGQNVDARTQKGAPVGPRNEC